jgi:hypothetical protein
MPANESIAYSDPGDDLTGKAGAAVIGRRFLKISGNKDVGSQALATDGLGGNIPVIHATGAAAEKPLGVSSYDQPTVGGKIPVMRGHKVVPVEAGAAITAGAQVQSDGTGRAVVLAAGVTCGVVLNSPTAAGQIAIVALDL